MLSKLAINTQQAIDKSRKKPRSDSVVARRMKGTELQCFVFGERERMRGGLGSVAVSQLQGLGFDPNLGLSIMHV